MGSAVAKLMGLSGSADRFAIPHADLRAAQIEAIDERFRERRERIKLLAHRAQEANLTGIRSLDDVVALLFPHTAYKSYPESWLSEEKWDRLGKWLGTISAYPIAPMNRTRYRSRGRPMKR